MIEEETKGSFDFDALRGAIEAKDPELLLDFYAEDAELRVVNAASPEGPAFELRGKAEIEKYLRAVCDQRMTCSIEDEVVLGEESITFDEMCAFPDGTLISVETRLEMGEGKIERQTDVARSTRREDRSER